MNTLGWVSHLAGGRLSIGTSCNGIGFVKQCEELSDTATTFASTGGINAGVFAILGGSNGEGLLSTKKLHL